MWLGSSEECARQPYVAYSLNRLITDWGRYVTNRLNERDKEDKPKYELKDLLWPPQARRQAAQHKATGNQPAAPMHSSQHKKRNPLGKAAVAEWQSQKAAMGQEVSAANRNSNAILNNATTTL